MSDDPTPPPEDTVELPEPVPLQDNDPTKLRVQDEVELILPPPGYVSVTTDEEPVTRVLPSSSPTLAIPEPVPLPPAPAPLDLSPVLTVIHSLAESLHVKFDGLLTKFERELRAESTRERIVDRLHAELQEYKQDMLLGVMKPVFLDLIQLHDDIGKMVAAQGTSIPEDNTLARQLLDTLSGYQQAIEDILYRQGVEPFSLEGETFDPRKQRAATTVATDDPSLAKTIAARQRKGFQSGERVLRPEVVSVYALKKV